MSCDRMSTRKNAKPRQAAAGENGKLLRTDEEQAHIINHIQSTPRGEHHPGWQKHMSGEPKTKGTTHWYHRGKPSWHWEHEG